MEKQNITRLIVTSIIVLIVCLFAFSSCKALEEVQKNTSITVAKSDSHSIKNEVTNNIITEKIYTPGNASSILEDPCDSLGNLKDIELTTMAGNFKARIYNLNGALAFNIQEIDILKSRLEIQTSLISEKDSINKSLQQKLDTFRHTTVTKTNYPKILWWSLFGNLIVILFIIKKYTRWFNFLPF